MLVSVCLLGVNVKVHATPQKLRPSRDTQCLYLSLKTQLFTQIYATCCVYIYINTADCSREEWRGGGGQKKQEKKEDLFRYKHRLAVMTAQNNLRSTVTY